MNKSSKINCVLIVVNVLIIILFGVNLIVTKDEHLKSKVVILEMRKQYDLEKSGVYWPEIKQK